MAIKAQSRLTILKLRFARSWKVIAVVSVLGTGLAVLFQRLDLFSANDAEVGAYDQGLKAFTNKPWFPFGQRGRSKDIVIVAIDDNTFEQVAQNADYRTLFGAWPYSRNVWAYTIDHLIDEGAKMIVLDVVFDEPHPDPSGDLALAQIISQRRAPVYFGFNFSPKEQKLPKTEPKNRLLERTRAGGGPAPTAEKSGAPSTEEFPSEEEFPSDEGAASAPATREARLQRVAQALAFPVTATEGLSLPKVPPAVLRDAQGNPTGEVLASFPRPPLEPLLDITPGLGAVLVEQDGDGKMRRTAFAYTDGINSYATLALAVAADYYHADTVEIAPGQLTLGRHVIPINRDGTAEIDFGGELGSRFDTVSLISVLDDYSNKRERKPRRPELTGRFKDKIVLIGGFGLGTADVKATPFSSSEPGVIKQASEIDNFIHRRFITEAPYLLSVLLAFCVAFFSVTLITVVKSTAIEIGWPLILFFGFFIVTGSFLVVTNVHLLSAMPMAAGEFASVAAVAFNHFFAKKDRERLRELFSSYMEKDLLEQMIEQRELPKLDGENQEVTAFFSDIRGFSTFSETFRDDPRALMKILNLYLTRVTAVLVEHGACIDKYIGDAVVCLFNAPMKNPDHAFQACRAALAVQEEIAQLREEFAARGLPDVYTRIGVNTDTMLVGNIGSAQLLDYTALGDGMNLTSRLEGANKSYETLILLGPLTYERVKDRVEAREVDWVRVAGKSQAVAVYELLALKGELPVLKGRVIGFYAEALARYREAKFDVALALLDDALALDPADGPSRTLRSRCVAYQQEPPPLPFDGISSLEK